MRRWATICLLILFASATTELGQLLKLPILVQHFYQHRQQEGLSLLQFLAEHYSNGHQDEDLKDDMRLPFKTMMDGPSMVATLPVQKPELQKPPAQPGRQPVAVSTSFIPSQLVFQIFHPPRTV